MEYDDILELVDGFGSYQRLLLAFVLLPAFVPCGFHAYNQIFMAASPKHFCKILNVSSNSFSTLTAADQKIRGKIVDECSMYDWEASGTIDNTSSETDILMKIYDENERITDQNGSLLFSTFSPMVSCKYGWDFDSSIYSSTIVTEWDIVCSKEFYPTLALVLFGFSGLIGNYFFGHIQDTSGRRPAFFIYLAIQCFFGVATGFAWDFWSWLIFRICVGFTVPAIMATPLILAQEIVGSKKRTLVTILLNIAYSLCLMALGIVAYFVRDWRNLAFVTSIPFYIFIIYWWVLPESPRWLFSHGKLEKTEEILRKIADINGRTLPEDFKTILKESYLASQESSDGPGSNSKGILNPYSLLHLFKGKTLRRNTIIITFIWFINMGVYVGLSYYAPALGGNEHFNFFIAGAAELPTYIFLYPLLENWGRRWTLFSSMVVGGIACVCTVLVKDEAWVTLTLYSIGKFGISAGFVAIQQMATEIYPTVVRGLGLSFSNVIGMVGPTLVPLVNYLGQEYLYLPLLTLGALMVVGGFAGLGLPETLGTNLPQSLEDAEKFRVDFSLRSCCPKKETKNKRRSLVVTNEKWTERGDGEIEGGVFREVLLSSTTTV